VSTTAAYSVRIFRVVPTNWAHDPLSGEGTRVHGGRYNPPGIAAFYSALDAHTAYAEYTKSLSNRRGLLCAFDVITARVIDISTNDGPETEELPPDDLVVH
jgi:RES domain-containing protein